MRAGTRVKLIAGSAACLTALAGAAGSAAAATGIPGREADPVVLEGADVPGLLGAQPSSVVAFSWDGGWKQIPVQVDERAMVDYKAVRQSGGSSFRAFSHLAYTDPGTFAGADPDPTLDGDDEIALMARTPAPVRRARAGPAGVEGGPAPRSRSTTRSIPLRAASSTCSRPTPASIPRRGSPMSTTTSRSTRATTRPPTLQRGPAATAATRRGPGEHRALDRDHPLLLRSTCSRAGSRRAADLGRWSERRRHPRRRQGPGRREAAAAAS